MDTVLSANKAPEAAKAGAATTRKVRTDYHLWGTYVLLVIIAVIELFSASIQEVTGGDIFRPVVRHGAFLVGGLVIMLVFQHIHYRYIYGLIPVFVLGCLGLMVMVHFAGSEGTINDAKRAINIAGIQLLPADMLKLAVALGMAWILTRNQQKGKNKRDVTTRGMWYSMIFLTVCAGLLFEHGLSNTLIVCAIGFSMMLIGGMSLKKIMLCMLIFGVLGGTALVLKMTSKPDPAVTERQERVAALNGTRTDSIVGAGRGTVWNSRITNHLRPNKHLEPFSTDKQQEQLSYIAQAHGGLIGVGVGRSRENARLPLAYSDYIFAIVIEELGLFAGLLILGVYMWILGRSAKLTMRFKQTLPAVLAMGCAFTIVFQALYHMAIVSGVFPVSGQPLPLISKGGISVLATSMAFGIMLSVARHAVRVTDTRAEARHEQDLLPDSAVADNPAMLLPSSTESDKQ